MGGNLVDMVRAQKFLEIIEEENLVENARRQGEHLLGALHRLAEEFPAVSNIRGSVSSRHSTCRMPTRGRKSGRRA